MIYSYGIYPEGSPLTAWRRHQDKVARRRRELKVEITAQLMPFVQHGLIDLQDLRTMRDANVARRIEAELGSPIVEPFPLIAEASSFDNQTATAETQNKKDRDNE